MTLEPGDLIATGTPPGVGPVNPGDRVEVEIRGWEYSRIPSNAGELPAYPQGGANEVFSRYRKSR